MKQWKTLIWYWRFLSKNQTEITNRRKAKQRAREKKMIVEIVQRIAHTHSSEDSIKIFFIIQVNAIMIKNEKTKFYCPPTSRAHMTMLFGFMPVAFFDETNWCCSFRKLHINHPPRPRRGAPAKSAPSNENCFAECVNVNSTAAKLSFLIKTSPIIN